MQIKDLQDEEIYNAMRKNQKGYWYLSVGTNTRRSGELKLTLKKVEYLFKKFGKKEY